MKFELVPLVTRRQMDVIGDLLRAGLLTQVGESEDRVTKVRAATTSLAVQLGSELRSLIPHAILAAVDETGAEMSEPMRIADKALAAEWTTYRNAFVEPPAELLRAILVAAVAEAAEEDPHLLAAGWYTLRSALEWVSVSRWKAPLSDLSKLWDDSVWETINQSWASVPTSSNLRMPAVQKFEDARIGVTSPAREQAETFVEASNYQVFAQQMQEGYVKHVDSMLDASETLAAESHRRSVELVRSFAGELGTRLREILAAQEHSLDSMQRRGDLLWWQQTAFSPSRRVAYRDLTPTEVPLIAALDLHLLMPTVAPLAAEHVLSELVANATDHLMVTIDELVTTSVDLPTGTGSAPRLLLDSLQVGGATPLFGRDRKVEAGRVAVLAFRDLQTRRLTTTSSSDST